MMGISANEEAITSDINIHEAFEASVGSMSLQGVVDSSKHMKT